MTTKVNKGVGYWNVFTSLLMSGRLQIGSKGKAVFAYSFPFTTRRQGSTGAIVSENEVIHTISKKM